MKATINNGSAVRLCVIGDPVAHSRSPRIQTAMLSALGTEGTYIAQPVKREELADFVARVRAGEFTGFNATMPHKQALFPMVDKLDDTARLCQAINTVCVENGKLVGYSTDGDGFVAALRQLDCDPAGKKIALLGSGGAARSVAMALARTGAERVAVCARNARKAADLCAPFPSILIPAGFDRDSLAREARSAQILINCTNLGMTGQGQFEDFSFLSTLLGSAVVCDLIYEPAETELIRHARELGHKTMNGLPLLVWQGVLALEKFLGRGSLDKEIMARAAFDALKD